MTHTGQFRYVYKLHIFRIFSLYIAYLIVGGFHPAFTVGDTDDHLLPTQRLVFIILFEIFTLLHNKWINYSALLHAIVI